MVTVDAGEMAKSIDNTGRVALYGIYFDFNKTDVKPESDATLEQIAALMKKDTALKGAGRGPYRQRWQFLVQHGPVAAPCRCRRRCAGDALCGGEGPTDSGGCVVCQSDGAEQDGRGARQESSSRARGQRGRLGEVNSSGSRASPPDAVTAVERGTRGASRFAVHSPHLSRVRESSHSQRPRVREVATGRARPERAERVEGQEAAIKARSAELHKELSVRDLAFAQILFIVGLQWVGVAAKQGPSHVFSLADAMLLFYVPSAAVRRCLSQQADATRGRRLSVGQDWPQRASSGLSSRGIFGCLAILNTTRSGCS